jgi:hypothetical protein
MPATRIGLLCLTMMGAAFAVAGCESNGTETATPSTSTSPLRTVTMTNVEVSDSDTATFEQIHPVPGAMTLSTSSTTELLACPGAWQGTVTRHGTGSWGSLWLGEDCISFNASNPATLPSVTTSNQHYAIAVVSTAGAITVHELRLTYHPGDDSQMCFVAKVERPCQ